MSNCSVDQRAPKRQSRSFNWLASLIAVYKSKRRKKSNSEALVVNQRISVRCMRSAAFHSLLAVEIVLTTLGVASWAPVSR
jgi:hypothetical protein